MSLPITGPREDKTIDHFIRRLMMLALLTLAALPLLASPLKAAESTRPPVIVEARDVATRAIMTVKVGDMRRVVQINTSGDRMHIQMKIKIDVSALVLSYHSSTLVDAYYDREGLLSFASEINEDGKITTLSGQRQKVVGEKIVMQLYGKRGDTFIDRQIPFDMIHYTNIESFAYAAAISREKTTWRVLNLFNGEVELVRTTPEGMSDCPADLPGECYRVSMFSPSRKGVFYYLPDGRMAYAEGEDTMGTFILKAPKESKATPPPEKPKSIFKSIFEGAFGTPSENGSGTSEPGDTQ